MSYVLNNISTADNYTDANTLRCPGAHRVSLEVLNAAIYYRIGRGTGAFVYQDEIRLSPGFRSRDVFADAVQVRSAQTGQPATVTIDAVPGELLPA